MKTENEKSAKDLAARVLKEDLIVPELKAGQKGLHLGCGGIYLTGWKNVDIDVSQKIDEVWDLNEYPYPYGTESFDYIILHHVIEHLDDPLETVRECSRILKKGGTLIMHYPHFSSGAAHLPTHKWTLCRNAFGIELGFSKRRIKILYSQFRRMAALNWFINKFGNHYEKLGVCYLFPAFEVQEELVK